MSAKQERRDGNTPRSHEPAKRRCGLKSRRHRCVARQQTNSCIVCFQPEIWVIEPIICAAICLRLLLINSTNAFEPHVCHGSTSTRMARSSVDTTTSPVWVGNCTRRSCTGQCSKRQGSDRRTSEVTYRSTHRCTDQQRAHGFIRQPLAHEAAGMRVQPSIAQLGARCKSACRRERWPAGRRNIDGGRSVAAAIPHTGHAISIARCLGAASHDAESRLLATSVGADERRAGKR